MSKVSPEWKAKIRKGKRVKWTVGVEGNGNEGVSQIVQDVNGATGCIELSYAENLSGHRPMMATSKLIG